jgi:hypothetical protein
MQALENTEEFFRIAHIKADPVVPHEEHRLACGAIRPRAYLDTGAGRLSRVLDRVADPAPIRNARLLSGSDG